MKKIGRVLKKVNWKLAAVLMISLAMLIFYGNQKEGYHVDEVYSYGLANSEYLPFMHFGQHDYNVKEWMMEYGAGESLGQLFSNLVKDFRILKECGFHLKESVIYQDYLTAQANSADTRTTSWMPGQAYLDYVAVSESNTFNYASVYYNQRGDVHPPLYYSLLHTICSVFQGKFSRWFGLGLNIAVLLMAAALLYKMCRLYLGGRTAALLTVGVYSLSAGFLSTAMFLRMYALLTFMVIAYCYMHLKIADECFRLKGKNRRRLVLAVLCGYLTHYYFVLYAIGVAAVFCIWMAVRRKWREMAGYVLTLAGAAAVGLCIWPFAIRHVFQGYRGVDSLNMLLGGNFYLSKSKLMFDQAAAWLFGGHGWLLLLCLGVQAGLLVWRRGRNLPVFKGLLLFVPIVFYTVTVSQIVPFLDTRYIMCTYPFWYLSVFGTTEVLLRQCSGKIADNSYIKTGVLAAVGALLLGVSCGGWNTPDHLYPGGQETVEIAENTDYVFIMADGDWNQSAVDSTILAQCRNVGVTYLSDMGQLAEDYEYQAGDVLIIAVQKDMDVEEVLRQAREAFGVEGLREIGRSMGSTSVRVILADFDT
ncbi:MAG TPA: hypothetical protein DCZ91_14790 [Lachnospiraceae bacterium]|nr:hypothetical protein [Lachnospiraceae bacterium]